MYMAMRWIYAAAVLVASQTAALSAILPDGGVTAQDIARVLQTKGYQTEITTDKDGDPLIRSTSEGVKFSVYFYECKGSPRCKSFQFVSGFSSTNITVSRVADWNRTKRFGKVYLDQQSDPWVEMDVDVEHGATTEALANDLDRWILTLGTFRKYIDR
jgi:hypothetical protein